MKQLMELAELIYIYIPSNKLPARVLEIIQQIDSGTPRTDIDCIFGYLKELATDYIDSCDNVVLPKYED